MRSLLTPGSPRIHLCDWGGPVGGRPLLLLHGMAGNTHWWDLAAPLLQPDFHPVAMDLRGHGDSERADGQAYHNAGFLADIEAARAAMGWERFIFLAHSLGARLALEYAVLHPERLAGLIVVDFLGEFLRGRSRRFERGLARPQPLYDDPEVMARRFHLEPPGTLLDDAALQALARHCIRAAGGRYTWKFDWNALRYLYEAIWPVLPRISVPTLVVRGGQSAVMSREDFERVLKELRGAQGVEIERAHHHLPLETPEELCAAVRSFADGLKREQLP